MRTSVPFDLGRRVDLDPGELGGLAVGGFLGASLAGVAMWVVDVLAMRLLGALVGLDTVGGGWLATLLLGVVLAVPFGAFVSGSIDGFVARVIGLSSRSDALQRLLVPLLNRSALAVTTAALGAAYGFAVGTLVYLLAVPLWLTAVGSGAAATPAIVVACVVGAIAFVVYGTALGTVYGVFLEA